jgi:hypothetical protein
MNPLVANVTASGRQEVYTRGAQYIYLIKVQLPYSYVKPTENTDRLYLGSIQKKKITLIYRPNGRREFGRPLNRLSDGPEQVYQGITGEE